MKINLRVNLLYFLLLFTFVGCSSDSDAPDPENPPVVTPGDEDEEVIPTRSRIAWDRSSLTKIFSNGNYSRVIEISKDNLVAVAGGPNGVQFSTSSDRGATWSASRIIAATQKGVITMSVPEILKLKNGNLLLTYNPRPVQPNDNTNLKYGIRARISTDNGSTWGDEIFVYDAHHLFDNGCWEPCAIQLPSGEIQVYFANENDYQTSNEQNISMCRSVDGGKTWSAREIVSFRSKSRDGMPVALHLPDTKEIIVAIEDNGYANHKNRMQPSIIRISEDWAGSTVTNTDSRREYALKEHLLATDNGAAPYICKSSTGEVLLSYQGNQGRDVPLLANGVKSNDYTQEMFVAVGDSRGRSFENTSAPFLLPLGPNPSDNYGYQGVWNSLSSFSTGEVFAVTSTNAFTYPTNAVYGIKGYMLNDITPSAISATIDGKLSECNGKYPSIVVGHSLNSTLYGYVCKSGEDLYLGFKMCGNTNVEHSNTGELKDGFEITLSSTDGSIKKTISVPLDGNITLGRSESLPNEFNSKRASNSSNEVAFECLIPYSYFENLNIKNTLAVNVKTFDSVNGKILTESVANTVESSIDTWLKIFVK